MTRLNASAELARIDRTASRVRLAVVFAAVALGFAAIALSVILTSLLPEQTVHEPGSWVPMGLSLLTVVVCVILTLAARSYLARHRLPTLVPEVERSVGLRRGELAGALELSSDRPVESRSLARFGRQLVADKLAAHENWELFPETLSKVGRRISWAGLFFVVVLGGLTVAAMRAPARMLAAATALGQPWTIAFPPPPPRIQITPGDTAVLRGDRLRVRTVAPMRDSVILVWQPVGEPISSVRLAAAPDGSTVGATNPIESPTRFWVEAMDGTRSEAHEVLPLDPLLITQMSIELTYPAYLQRPAESLNSFVGDIEVPAGTVIRIEGRTNEPLSRARLVEDASEAVVEFEVDGLRFSADWRPRNEGNWTWSLEPASTLPGIRAPEPFSLRAVVDLVPVVEVVYPGRDTAASVDLRLPLVIDARDDIGLAIIDLETWRISAAGVQSAPEIVPLWEAPTAQRQNLRIVLRPVLRLDVLDLVPGDTLFYIARSRDIHPGHRPSVSDTFRVFVPSLTELRRSAAERAEQLAASSRELRDNAADLARATRDAQRRSEGAQNDRSSGVPDASEFGATEESRRILERGQELDQRIADMERRMDELREGSEESGLADAAMREKFEQLEELFRQIEETGLGEQLRQLEQALRNLDSRQTHQELGDLSSKLRELEARLEQTLALMERVAIEQTMNDATDSAQQLANRQSALADAFEQDESWADQQGDVAADADRLVERLEALREKLTAQGLDAAADSVARGSEQMSAAAADMQAAQEAARSGGRSRSQGGQSSASQASEQMQESAQAIESAGEMLNEDWKQEALEAVGTATQEALDLAREQAVLSADLSSQGGQPPANLAGRQASLIQGLDRLLESLSEAGKKTALIDRSVGSTAAEARDRMQELGEALGGREGPPRGASAESMALVETLNDLAGRLMASRRKIEAAGSATGMQEALDQLAQMSQSQAGLNRESGGLMLMQQNGQLMEVALQRLAERQKEIARELEKLAGRPEAAELPARLELLATEADEIARNLASGQLDQNTLRRQEQLFRRLLDAGRSLERDEDPERREAKAADLSRAGSVPEQGAETETGPRFPYPDDAALRAASRSDRQLILDYFDRLNAVDGAAP